MYYNSIEIEEFEPAAAAASFVKPGCLFYHASWLAMLGQYYGYRFWKTCGPEGEYLLFAEVQGMLGPKLVSLPFSDYTIPAVRPDYLPLHVAAVQRAFPKAPVIIKCTDLYASPNELRFLGAPAAKAYLHRISVADAPRNGFSASFRRGVRKARKNGLTAAPSREEQSLLHFYKLYYQLRTEKLGLIPQPLAFFSRVYEQFIRKGDGFFYEVKQEGEVVASAVVLRQADTLYYKWGCSSQERLHLRPNNLLFQELIALAAEKDCAYLDLGLSDLDETRGLIRFKKSMGGVPSFIYTYLLFPPDYPVAVEQKLKTLVNQMAGLVVEHKLNLRHTQEFSQALYPLFI